MAELSHPSNDAPDAGAGASLVAARNLVKLFGKTRALDAISLEVNAGETFGLIGPNGSGKTTLIRVLLGVGAPTSGEALVLGRRMPDRSVASRIGYMSQASVLYSDLSVRENLAFFGALYGLRGNRLDTRIKETLELVDLADQRGKTVGVLSGGMRQRVSLAAALIHRPQLLFLDEPTVGIDPELRLQFWDYFGVLNRQGVTILVSTHSLDEAKRCHRLALLRFGKLIALDTPDALLRASGQDDFDQAFLFYARRDQSQEAAAHTTARE